MKTIKAKVYRLPTGKSTMLDGVFETDNPAEMDSVIQNYHLYITTEPENDDFDIDQWVLFNNGEVFQVHSISQDYLFNKNGKQYDPDYCETIIATTADLTPNGTTEFGAEQGILMMPQIPQSFIEEYCKQGGIDEVLVEYIGDKGSMIKGQGFVPHSYKPKLNPDNTIIIHPVEVDWEVEMRKCKESPWYYATNYLIINGKPFKTLLTEEEFNKKWIEENL